MPTYWWCNKYHRYVKPEEYRQKCALKDWDQPCQFLAEVPEKDDTVDLPKAPLQEV